MKINRTYLFITISSLALITVLVIQVYWILESAKMKEAIFNEKANMVLIKTAEALSSDDVSKMNLQMTVGENEINKIDSLFVHYMKLYDFQLEYHFDIQPSINEFQPAISGSDLVKEMSATTILNTTDNNSFQTCLPETPEGKRLDLKLILPGKEHFILAELGTPFIASILMILIVLILSWRTILSLIKEKQISENTSEFLNNMTHEFKTPITNISLAGKMISREAESGHFDKIHSYSEIILDENEKLKLQVEQVLSMTALEQGEIPLNKVDFDFHEIIDEAAKSMSLSLQNVNGKIELNLNASSTKIHGDRTHLKNAICNLIENAIKYCATNPHVQINTENEGDKLKFQITDNGIGMEKKHYDKIFQKFFRIPTGDIHNVKGFGLGLSYTKNIIESHHGTISVTSAINRGTTFIILLHHV